jgi:hypothetical protein
MKLNQWTLALATAGVVSLGSAVQAEEAANQVLTALSSTTLSGYIDTSANWRLGTGTGALPGRSFDGADKQDGFNLNVVGLTLEKPLDEGQWAAGYKTDLLFGPDANYYSTVLNGGGLEGQNSFNIKQAYAVFRAPVGNGIDFKMGVFDTVVGYEVFESANNPNYSRSYGFFLEPTHHTGLLASYHVTDAISIAAGVANTSYGPINGKLHFAGTGSETQKTYMGAITAILPENLGPLAGSAIYAGIVDGRAFGNNRSTTIYYIGHTLATPIEGLAIGAAFDHRIDADPAQGAFATGPVGPLTPILPRKNWAWATALYASFQATENLRLNLRGDVTRATDGTYFDGGTRGIPDRKNELLSITGTVEYGLWSSLVTRLEARWDRALSGRGVFEGQRAGGRVLEDIVTDRNAVTLALNMVYKF